MTGEPTRLGLEVRFDAEPIEGRLVDDRRVVRRFSGWLGLMAAIEAAAPGAARRGNGRQTGHEDLDRGDGRSAGGGAGDGVR
ncbi:MAG TPA: hypothetical protein VF549_17490 [Solirubrobacteraceae bacterium]|jgi:hypothetical protein